MIEYTKVLFILLIPLLLILGFAYIDVDYSLDLEKVDLSEFLSGQNTIVADTVAMEQKDTALIDTTRQRILLFGDSMVEGLGFRLADYTTASGHELTSVCWYSSSTLVWASCDTLAYFMNKAKPTIVIITLGSNEQFVRDLDKREDYIRHILSVIGDTPYVWICSPAWKQDTGINDLALSLVGHKRFFESRNLTFERGKDNIHPTRSSAAEWMDSIVEWLQSAETAHPITFVKPEQDIKRKWKALYLKPPTGKLLQPRKRADINKA